LKILRGEHGYRSGISVTSLARSVLQAPLLGGFAAFRAERLCLSVGHLFIEAMPPTEAEPHRYRNASERQSLSARNAAKPLERQGANGKLRVDPGRGCKEDQQAIKKAVTP